MVYVHYPIEQIHNGGGAIIRRVVPVRDSSEDGYYGVAGEFILNDLMRRAGKSR